MWLFSNFCYIQTFQHHYILPETLISSLRVDDKDVVGNPSRWAGNLVQKHVKARTVQFNSPSASTVWRGRFKRSSTCSGIMWPEIHFYWSWIKLWSISQWQSPFKKHALKPTIIWVVLSVHFFKILWWNLEIIVPKAGKSRSLCWFDSFFFSSSSCLIDYTTNCF